MLNSMRKMFAPPVFEGEEKTRVARILHSVLMVGILATIGVAIASAARGDRTTVVVMLVTSLFLVMSLGWVRRGNLTLPSVIVPLLAVGAVTFIVSIGDGVHDIGMFAYSLALVFAGLLLG